MEDVSSAISSIGQEDLGTLLDDASKFVENCNASEANTIGADKASTFATLGGPSTSCSKFYSERIASMMTSRIEFETELEFWTTHSKVHWSELSDPKRASGNEDLSIDHRPHFEKLQKDAHWGPFCSQVTNVVLGRKLGEGAQADIYEAQVTFVREEGYPKESIPMVVKLMKGDCALEDLQRQWPHGVGSFMCESLLYLYGALVKEPTMKKSKFGFVMDRFWGDLRSLIDLRMEHKNAQGPPFSLPQVKCLMYWIAHDMGKLHKRGIIHRDLKASNILVKHYAKECDIVFSSNHDFIVPYVADWECSMGVVGTGWWRAPEILLQLKNGTPSSKLEFNEKVDVYSFSMTCYEIAIGRTPFEDCSILRDAILNGARPELPHDLDLDIKVIITSCWDPNPSLRPSFGELKQKMANFHL